MQKLSKLAAVLLIGCIGFPVSLAAAEKNFITVNGVGVPARLVDFLVEQQKAQGAADSSEIRQAIREDVIRQELLVQEAKKAKIDRQPSFATEIELARRSLLINAYVQDFLKKNPVADAQIKARYDEVKARAGTTEYKARHILVASEDEANAIIADLKKGVSFEALVGKSIDPGSKERNGDLGWNIPSNFLQAFSDALVKLKKGAYTETPVKTTYGYHVILLDDSRPSTFPTFEEVKPRITQQMQAQKINQMIADLRAKANVK